MTIAYDQNAIDWSAAVTLFCKYYSHKLNNKEVHLATDTRSLDFKSQAKQLMKVPIKDSTYLLKTLVLHQ